MKLQSRIWVYSLLPTASGCKYKSSSTTAIWNCPDAGPFQIPFNPSHSTNQVSRHQLMPQLINYVTFTVHFQNMVSFISAIRATSLWVSTSIWQWLLNAKNVNFLQYSQSNPTLIPAFWAITFVHTKFHSYHLTKPH